MIVLLGKKQGGSRTLGFLSPNYRLLMRILLPEVKKWCAQQSLPGNSAEAGASSLIASLTRQLMLELSSLIGISAIAICCDSMTFHDRLLLSKVF